MKKFPRIILLFLTVDWPIFMRRKMLYGLAIAARKYDCTVVAVNRPLCPFTTLITKTSRLREYFAKPSLQKLDQNLFLYSPRYFLLDQLAENYDFLKKLNIRMLRNAYSALCKRLAIEESKPLIWYHHPQQGYVCKLFDGSVNILELYDNLANYQGQESSGISRLEKKCRPNTDLLLATSPRLLEKYGKNYGLAWLSGNGLDRDTYLKFTDPLLAPDLPLTTIPSPRVGYAGIISRRLDWKLVENLAAGLPHVNFIFVGPLDRSAPDNALKKYHNIHFTGPYEHKLMPAVLKSFDLGIMPYKDNNFFRFSNPLKFYEFAAAGLRMVSSNMEILQNFNPDFVRIVPNDGRSWIRAIIELLNLDKEQALEIGREIAGKHLWDDLYDAILEKINAEFFGEYVS